MACHFYILHTFHAIQHCGHLACCEKWKLLKSFSVLVLFVFFSSVPQESVRDLSVIVASVFKLYVVFADHVTVSYARSGGPGGQNVNKGMLVILSIVLYSITGKTCIIFHSSSYFCSAWLIIFCIYNFNMKFIQIKD